MFQKVINTVISKGLISSSYPYIYKGSLEGIEAPPSRRRWEQDVGTITGLKCSRIMELGLLFSLSPSQRMFHLFLLYKAYYTPQKLFLFGRKLDASCPKWGNIGGSNPHVLLLEGGTGNYRSGIWEGAQSWMLSYVPGLGRGRRKPWK